MSRGVSTKTIHWRLFFILIFLVAGGAAILARLFLLQIIEYRTYVTLAARQHGGGAVLLPRRGTILAQDKNGNRQALALDKSLFLVSANPKQVADQVKTASLLAPILGVSYDTLFLQLSQKDTYEVLAKKIDDDAAAKIRALDLPGISLEDQSRRIYPGGSMAAAILGFAKFDQNHEVGEYGIEKQFDAALTGNTSLFEGVSNSSPESLLTLGRRIIHPPIDGKDIVLTIDYNIQQQAEAAADELMKKWTPEAAYILVIDPSSGKILAAVIRPTFDPNNYGSVKSLSVFKNALFDSIYELGSVMKPVTMAAAINEGVITPDTSYTDPGIIHFGRYYVENYDQQSHGVLTMTQVLEKSLNTGAVFVEEKLAHAKFLEYLKAFGFGEKTGVDIPGEVRGNISNLVKNRDIDYATASFGQGIAVTPIQMAIAMSAIANGGNLVRPYIVDSIIDDSGAVVNTSQESKRRVISRKTSETVTKMLVSVTEHGFDNHAAVKGFFVAGKTGTAQVANVGTRGYSSGDFIHSFAGYAPAFTPKFLIYMQMVKPKGVHYASTSLTPTFHNLASYILNYYNIPPDHQ
ncbi:MAG: penicillin-binding protein 2 [Candidatus Sungbacteria bacterium]|uniref:Penicillin-binding protein 2 n=1 Tax=Candidatus Sungiibacteriota bacterium TaxID=2750080 RepID=A0A9D6QTL7_9BACT|nr:penicillin-binding protein 2 [Candidatus Sungbacteria bacterium]